jgi:hypothetical protein
VGVAGALSDETRDRPAGDRADRLHKHLKVEAIGEAPEDLTDIVARERAEVLGGSFGCG